MQPEFVHSTRYPSNQQEFHASSFLKTFIHPSLSCACKEKLKNMELVSKQADQEEPSLTTSIVIKHVFHKVSLTLLSLLLPLSFLLLSRMSSPSPMLSPSIFVSFTLRISSLLLQSLVAIISLSTLYCALTSRIPRPPLFISWTILFIFQASVSFGIESSIAAGVQPVAAVSTCRVPWIAYTIFFIGLYETMMTWVKMLVKPVADDTIFMSSINDCFIDKVVVGLAYSVLWMKVLQDEMEPLVLAVGNEGLVMHGGCSGLLLWLIGYVTTIAGLMKIILGAVWMIEKLLFFHCRDAEEDSISSYAPV
ncbi:hypothetical protein J5N97_015393 [Dioscorea zingiberensis]|uniref:Transmembrane protein n=1 Tax=Dioscorea zingiberensis TaxID=325984 RepID=A0A9D5CVZ6_9LILI|nr:hypothetical protein J5N97_015393 [Dioscorea zingiberensis]